MSKNFLSRLRSWWVAKQFASCAGDFYMGPLSRFNRPQHARLGQSVRLGVGCQIYTHPHKDAPDQVLLEMGNRVNLTNYITLAACHKLILEDEVMMGSYCFIGDHVHGYKDPRVAPQDQPVDDIQETRIGQGAWLASHVCVFPGAHIGRHAVIGAHAVVTKPVPDFCLAIGNPAKVIKTYDESSQAWVRV